MSRSQCFLKLGWLLMTSLCAYHSVITAIVVSKPQQSRGVTTWRGSVNHNSCFHATKEGLLFDLHTLAFKIKHRAVTFDTSTGRYNETVKSRDSPVHGISVSDCRGLVYDSARLKYSYLLLALHLPRSLNLTLVSCCLDLLLKLKGHSQ